MLHVKTIVGPGRDYQEAGDGALLRAHQLNQHRAHEQRPHTVPQVTINGQVTSTGSGPFHFDADPDPRIRFRDNGSGSRPKIDQIPIFFLIFSV